jgi:hypothetical protein
MEGSNEGSPVSPRGERNPLGVLTILQKRGSQIESLPGGLFLDGNTPARAFIDASGLGRDSLFAQFATLRYAEGMVGEEITGVTRRGIRGDKLTSSASNKIASLKVLEAEVRGARRAIGEDIFGDQAEVYATSVHHMITRGPTGANTGEARREGHKKFGDEIRRDFPRAEETEKDE